MKSYITNQKGFHILPIALVIIVVGVMGLVGYKVMNGNNKKDDVKSQNDGSGNTQTISGDKNSESNEVTWAWGGDKWLASGTAPDCKDGPVFASPVDETKVTSVLYPGQTRG